LPIRREYHVTHLSLLAIENIGPEPVDVKVNAQFARSTRLPGAILHKAGTARAVGTWASRAVPT
jgi:hypothetical protein